MGRQIGLRATSFREGSRPPPRAPSLFTRARKQLALAAVAILTVVGGAIAATSSSFVKDRLAPVLVVADRWICKATTYVEPPIAADRFHVLVARLAGDPGDSFRDRLKFGIHENTTLPVSETCQRVNMRTDGPRLIVLSRAHDEAQRLLKEHGGDLLVWGHVVEPGVATLHLTGRGVNMVSRRYRVALTKLDDFLRDALLVEAMTEAVGQSYQEDDAADIHRRLSKLNELLALQYDQTWKPALKEQTAKLERAMSGAYFALWTKEKEIRFLRAATHFQTAVFKTFDEDPTKSASPGLLLDRLRLMQLLWLLAAQDDKWLDLYFSMASARADELDEKERRGDSYLQLATALELRWRVRKQPEDKRDAIAFACNALGIFLNESEQNRTDRSAGVKSSENARKLLKSLDYDPAHVKSREDCPI